MSDPIEDMKAAIRKLRELERAVVCNPEYESRLKMGIEARGLAGVIKVYETPSCPVDRIYVINTGKAKTDPHEIKVFRDDEEQP
jgi:hypothetical protein